MNGKDIIFFALLTMSMFFDSAIIRFIAIHCRSNVEYSYLSLKIRISRDKYYQQKHDINRTSAPRQIVKPNTCRRIYQKYFCAYFIYAFEIYVPISKYLEYFFHSLLWIFFRIQSNFNTMISKISLHE